MLGRLACQNPYALAVIHHALYPNTPLAQRSTILDHYIGYAQSEHRRGVPMSLLLKPIFNLAHGIPGAKTWKQQLMRVQQAEETELLEQVVSFLLEIEQNTLCIND